MTVDTDGPTRGMTVADRRALRNHATGSHDDTYIAAVTEIDDRRFTEQLMALLTGPADTFGGYTHATTRPA